MLLAPTNIPAARAQARDWSTFLWDDGHSGFNSTETVITPASAPNLKVHWSIQAAGHVSAQPIVANGMLYWGSYDGLEHASSLVNGTDIWTANLGQATDCRGRVNGVLSTPTVASALIGGVMTPVVIVGGGDAKLYALNADTGKPIWSVALGTPPATFLYSPPTVFNGSVYIGVSAAEDCLHIPGAVVQLDTATGATQHTFNVVPTGCLGGSIWSSPTIDVATGMVYVSTGEKSKCKSTETLVDSLIELRAADLSLVSTWQIPAAQTIMDGDFGSSPTLFNATIGGVARAMVGLVNKNGIFYAFDRTNLGAGPLWQVRLATPPGPSVSSSAWDGQSLYVAAGPTILNGVSCKGNLSALNPATGATQWRDCLGFDALGGVIAVPGLVELADGGTFFLAAAATGATLFKFRDTHSHSMFLGPGSVSNGVLYQGNMDGLMYAFGL
jgi:polyvinyl alcohol dehydrogenase (cytochrome)